MNMKKQTIIQISIVLIGLFVNLFGVILFNKYLLMSFPVGVRMVLMLVSQWLLFLIPAIMMWIHKEQIINLGFNKKNIPFQIGIGVILAFVLSLLFTVVPILLGFGDLVGNIRYTQVWQFVYEFVYAIFGVALIEELIFRGYIYYKLLQINDNKVIAIMISSILFGLFHGFNGNMLQVLMTTLLGIVFCVLREKIKNCTTLSLIIVHGVYNALIILWVSILS